MALKRHKAKSALLISNKNNITLPKINTLSNLDLILCQNPNTVFIKLI